MVWKLSSFEGKARSGFKLNLPTPTSESDSIELNNLTKCNSILCVWLSFKSHTYYSHWMFSKIPSAVSVRDLKLLRYLSMGYFLCCTFFKCYASRVIVLYRVCFKGLTSYECHGVLKHRQFVCSGQQQINHQGSYHCPLCRESNINGGPLTKAHRLRNRFHIMTPQWGSTVLFYLGFINGHPEYCISCCDFTQKDFVTRSFIDAWANFIGNNS